MNKRKFIGMCAGAILIATAGSAFGAALELTPGNVDVVIAKDAVPVVRFAADEMTNFLSRALGCAIPVRNVPDPARASLILGDNEWSRAAGFETAKMGQDALRIKCEGRRVYIAGQDDATADPRDYLSGKMHGRYGTYFRRGTMFGVYEFLERYADAGFYFCSDLGTVVPKATRLTVPEGDFTVAPAFLERSWSYHSCGEPWDGLLKKKSARKRKKEWMAHVRSDVFRLRMATQYHTTCHGLRNFHLVRRFAKTHPEYFKMNKDGTRYLIDTEKKPYSRNGKLCLSNRGLREEIYQDVKAFLTGQSAESRGLKTWERRAFMPEGVVDIGMEDGYQECFCPDCQKAYDHSTPKYATKLVWGFWLEIANRLKKEGIPGRVTFGTDYSAWEMPKDVVLPDNIAPHTGGRGPWSVRRPKDFAKDIARYRDTFNRFGHKNNTWVYSGKFKCLQLDVPDIPDMTPRAFVTYYRAAAPYLTGSYDESQTDRYLFEVLNHYVYSKVAWDPNLDAERLFERMYRQLFGAGADEMRRFCEALEDLWLTRIRGKVEDTALGPVNLTPNPYEIWTDIYSDEFLTRARGWFDAAAGKVAADSDEAKRIALFRQEILERMIRAGTAFRASIDPAAELARRAAQKPVNLIPAGEDFTKWKKRGYDDAIEVGDGVLFEGHPTALISLAEGRREKLATYLRTPVRLEPGKRYRFSYFVKTDGVKRWSKKSGVTGCVWPGNKSQDKTFVNFPSPYLDGTVGWTHFAEEFDVPADYAADAKPYVTLRLLLASGKVRFAAPLLEEVKTVRSAE